MCTVHWSAKYDSVVYIYANFEAYMHSTFVTFIDIMPLLSSNVDCEQ